jgi:hypothetical protein
MQPNAQDTPITHKGNIILLKVVDRAPFLTIINKNG